MNNSRSSKIRKWLLYFLGAAVVITLTLIPSQKTEEKNPYLNEVPDRYVPLLVKGRKGLAKFETYIYENSGYREVVIVSRNGNAVSPNTRFQLSILLDESSGGRTDTTFTLTTESKGVKYGFREETILMYTIPITGLAIKDLGIQEVFPSQDWSLKIQDLKAIIADSVRKNEIISKCKYLEASPYSWVAQVISINQFAPTSYPSYQILMNNVLIGFLDEESCGGACPDMYINNPKLFFKLLNQRDPACMDLIHNLRPEVNRMEKFQHYLNGTKTIDQVFDLDRLAAFESVLMIYGNNCLDHWIFMKDRETELWEPAFNGLGCVKKGLHTIQKSQIDIPQYHPKLINKLTRYLKLDMMGVVLGINSMFTNPVVAHQRNNPFNVVDLDELILSQKVVEKSLYPSVMAKIELIDYASRNIELQIQNVGNYPIELKSLFYRPNKHLKELDPIVIPPKATRVIEVRLPRSFENLFVDKKSKKSGFNIHDHGPGIGVQFTLIGQERIQEAFLQSYLSEEEIKEDWMRVKSTVTKFPLLDHQNDTLRLTKPLVIIEEPLIIPLGTTLILEAGQKIDIHDGGMIIAHGPIQAKGTKENPVQIFSSDQLGQGLMVLARGDTSFWEHTVVSDLTNPSRGDWSVSGMANFYESPVKMEAVSFLRNNCEDALNVVRSGFALNACTFNTTLSDAFDGDFVEGTITNSNFLNCGNDGIDVSGSDILVTNCKILKANDKAISAGEGSKIIGRDLTINECAIGITTKDSSHVEISGCRIENTHLGLTAFQKKSEYGPSSIYVENIDTINIKVPFLVEVGSVLLWDGKEMETADGVMDRMYGVEFGVSSKDTQKK